MEIIIIIINKCAFINVYNIKMLIFVLTNVYSIKIFTFKIKTYLTENHPKICSLNL